MRRSALLVIWLITDVVVFLAAYACAYVLRVGLIFSTDFPLDHFLVAALVAVPVWLAALITSRTFALTRRQRELRSAAYILYACMVGAAVFALSYYFLFGQFFSRLLLVFAFLLSAIFTWAWHIAFGAIQRFALRANPPVYPTLIVGVTRESTALIHTLQSGRSPLKPVAVLDARGTKQTSIHGVPVRGKLNKLDETLRDHRITHLIHCSDLEHSLNLLSACRNHHITYMLLPSVLGIIGVQESMETLEGQPVTVVRPRRGIAQWFFG